MSEEKGLLGFNGETPDTLGILLHIVGAGGGAGATTLATMLGSCAAEMPRNDLTDYQPTPSESPWVVIMTAESVDQASKAVWLRDQALANGWRVAAIITKGTEKNMVKAVSARFIPISDDEKDRNVWRFPYWPQAASIPLAEFPQWDFSRQIGKKKRVDTIPVHIAELFTKIVDYIYCQEAWAERIAEIAGVHNSDTSDMEENTSDDADTNSATTEPNDENKEKPSDDNDVETNMGVKDDKKS